MPHPEYWTKEAVYDEQIAPLMARIIAICKEHEIPLACSFQYENDEDNGEGLCATVLAPGSWTKGPQISALAKAHMPKQNYAFAETHTTQPDGSKHISIRRVS